MIENQKNLLMNYSIKNKNALGKISKIDLESAITEMHRLLSSNKYLAHELVAEIPKGVIEKNFVDEGDKKELESCLQEINKETKIVL